MGMVQFTNTANVAPANAAPMTRSFAAPSSTPIDTISGIKMMAATVCDTKVDTTQVKSMMQSIAAQGYCSGSCSITASEM